MVITIYTNNFSVKINWSNFSVILGVIKNIRLCVIKRIILISIIIN